MRKYQDNLLTSFCVNFEKSFIKSVSFIGLLNVYIIEQLIRFIGLDFPIQENKYCLWSRWNDLQSIRWILNVDNAVRRPWTFKSLVKSKNYKSLKGELSRIQDKSEIPFWEWVLSKNYENHQYLFKLYGKLIPEDLPELLEFLQNESGNRDICNCKDKGINAMDHLGAAAQRVEMLKNVAIIHYNIAFDLFQAIRRNMEGKKVRF